MTYYEAMMWLLRGWFAMAVVVVIWCLIAPRPRITRWTREQRDG